MSAGTPGTPAQKSNKTLFIVLGLVGCLGLGCLGTIVVAIVAPTFLVAMRAPEPIAIPAPAVVGEEGDEEVCCCLTTSGDGSLDWETLNECKRIGGRCTEAEFCPRD